MTLLPDGYSATLRGAEYDVVVDATNQSLDTNDVQCADAIGSSSQEAGGGASIALNNYCVSYQVQVNCRRKDPDAPENACISQSDLLGLASRMLTLGGQGL